MQSDLFGNVPEIVIDVHETGGKTINSVKHLMSMMDKEGIRYTVEKIPIGDILGSDGIAIERKTVNDLVNTLKGSAAGVPRLTKQMDALLEYEKPYVLLENILAIRRDPVKRCVYIPFSSKQTKGKPFFVTMERAAYIHPHSLDALIQSIRDKGIEVLEGFNALHSAGLLYGVLFGEKGKRKKTGQRLPIIRTRKGLDSISDEQEFFIAGFPGVNVVRAKSLLDKFGSPFDVVSNTDEWGEIDGIGSKTIATAKKMLHTKYEPESAEEEESSEQNEEK
ncbi:MAG: ERCC4 domain-containing protein [Candidatus Thorarchaeota archaeon]